MDRIGAVCSGGDCGERNLELLLLRIRDGLPARLGKEVGYSGSLGEGGKKRVLSGRGDSWSLSFSGESTS